MAVFNAGAVGEQVTYDFTAFITGCQGAIKEPTDLQLESFGRAAMAEENRFRKLVPELPDDANADQIMAQADAISIEESLTYLQNMAAIYSALCSGQPSAEQLMELPRRVRREFYAFLRDEVVNPEAGAGAGNGQASSQTSSAAG